MKKYCLLLIISLQILSLAKAQESDFRPRFMIGPTGGVNLSSVIFQPTIQEKIKLGYDAGIVMRYDVTRFAGVWVEVDYSMRGWKEVNENVPGYEYTRSVSFVNVPVMTHFMIGSGAVKATIDAGAHFGYYLGERSNTILPDDGETKGVVTVHHDTPIQNKFAWGVGGGAGVEYHTRHMVVGVRGSYVYGFGDLFHNTRSDIFVKSSEQIIAAKAYVLYAF